ncbi:prolyl oligopeptidase family serine peptidase (plasmid) [Herbiconiux sp. KACC 21604]|uniref:alpha/beta hydrolase family protein n=1 Tax=unclassified Herbiconiux TaxID=2618217 RepID=UPI001492EFB1|nr:MULTISPECIES: prolyl oligopeptidase family serine peptidase [unclassified Herbiconiux]QJU56309.1 prolyl oligopeptidase family serine peptidase [Herbiconiux sp. SALV-R1]WPO88815.1 prolyl oligopeptidase family serine peptidase [Herbiconiux sp. KACC 21604]
MSDRTTDDAGKARSALRRAMPVTRMLDYGMDHWDATHLTAAPDHEPWDQVASALGEAQVARAEHAARRGDTETAVAGYRRATAAFYFAQLAFNSDTERKRLLYDRLSETYQAAARFDRRLRIDRLSIPWGGGSCAAWLVRPPGVESAPTVVIVGGQSGWGAAFHQQAAAFAERGLSTLLLEAPGQGETRMRGGLHLGSDVDGAFSAALDAIEAFGGASGRFGIWGNSFGGLLAARAAVHDRRFAACCINGAAATPVPLPYRAAREQTHALLGVQSDDAAERILRALWLSPPVDRTDAAVLIVHGDADPLVSREQQEVFLGLSDRAELRVWDDGEHTIYNHSAERTEVICDWFRARLRG